MTALLFFALSLSVSFAAVFGVDDRVSIRPGSEGYAESRSTAIAVLSSNVEEKSPGKLRLNVDPIGDLLCPTERFAQESSLSYACSGFLVAPDLIATAGHCMVNTGESRNETELYCKAFSWLFDYNETLNTEAVPAEKLYRCKRVVYAVKDEKAPYRDYALVELDRPVKGRTPFVLSDGPVSLRDSFRMIGHPFGLPAKLSKNARLLVNTPSRQSFLTSLDAFEGNSGSAVLNARGEIVGILVGGTPSLNTLPRGSCEVVNRCSERGTQCLAPDKDPSVFPGYQGVGSEVQRIAPVKALLKTLREI